MSVPSSPRATDTGGRHLLPLSSAAALEAGPQIVNYLLDVNYGTVIMHVTDLHVSYIALLTRMCYATNTHK